MKKLILLVSLIGVVSSPIELKKEINIFEDEEIVKRYIEYLEDVNVEDYLPYINVTDFISEVYQPNNNVINPVSDINIIGNHFDAIQKFDFDVKNLKNIIKKELSTELSAKIDKSISELSNHTNIEALFFDGNNDLNKLNNLKKDLVDFANDKLKIFGELSKGNYINNENNAEVYNNVIELELE
ncbi:hypothetical protein KX935_03135 [Streptobacillus moniliformis]|uniref:hypothetical protein n=1 Tax=Streptobacillus moniliformis TaxID=34105 RepID=UPI0007E40F4D|nr:hypothetical protein [Streptobacillus moniliformis]QXW66225.1 hypothetical protein KX935_03135 [Streptobacillus moniliformis]